MAFNDGSKVTAAKMAFNSGGSWWHLQALALDSGNEGR
jgi:hypothetical protein